MKAWRHGRAQAVVYNARLGGAHYFANEIGGRVFDYGVSDRLPALLVDGVCQRSALTRKSTVGQRITINLRNEGGS
jgi:hypothetical protein